MSARGALLTVAVACAMAIAPTRCAAAQPPAEAPVGLRLNGQVSGGYFGGSVTVLGDIDGDSVPDLAIGAAGYYTSLPGTVRLYSGADWIPIRSLNGESAGDGFGWSVAAVGDVNSDGRADLLVGAPLANPSGRTDAGTAYLYSGRDGTLIDHFDGENAGDWFGEVVAAVGDVDGDHVADFMVGARYSDPQELSNAGSAFLYSGATRAVLGRFDGAHAGDELGRAVAGPGDVNGDGVPDLLVGAGLADPGGLNNAGAAYLYSGADGSVLKEFDGEAAEIGFGSKLCGVGDVNGDGTPDVLISAPWADIGAVEDSGAAYLYSGADYTLIKRFDGTGLHDYYGTSVASAGDVDGDEIPDFIIATPAQDVGGLADAGVADVYSGANRTIIRRFAGMAQGDTLGNAVAGAGDANADGRADLLIGAPSADPGGVEQSGSVWIVTGCCPPMTIKGGAACTNSRSVSLGMTVVGGAQMRFKDAGGVWTAWQPYSAAAAWTLPMGDGLKVLYAQFVDLLGSTSVECQQAINLDTVPPVAGSIVISEGVECVSRWDVGLALSATEASDMRFRNEGGAWSAWQPYSASASWTLSAGRGPKQVSFQCRDACGNQSNVVSDTIWINSFEDVPCTNSAWSYVETLVANRITSGCAVMPPMYCPYNSITRAQMAVFLCRAAGKGPLDRETPTFADVPKTDSYYGYIERLADAASWGGVAPTSGCRADDPGTPENEALFCPYSPVTREQMAKFLCLATGRPPMPVCMTTFADAGEGNPFCQFIERLADPDSWPGGVAVTSGCAVGPPRLYCPKSPVTRGQMAVFIVRAFGLTR